MKAGGDLFVTPEMVDAAMEELWGYRLGGDLRALAERIYLAMHYARLRAS